MAQGAISNTNLIRDDAEGKVLISPKQNVKISKMIEATKEVGLNNLTNEQVNKIIVPKKNEK